MLLVCSFSCVYNFSSDSGADLASEFYTFQSPAFVGGERTNSADVAVAEAAG